ncbi:hypothetical protein [Solimicrobium silvestre]|nr:hypothetical protein [Solimicrobium silvestre]
MPDTPLQVSPKTDRLKDLNKSIKYAEDINASKTLDDRQKYFIVSQNFESVASDESMIGDVFGAMNQYGKYNKYLEERELKKSNSRSNLNSRETSVTEDIQHQIQEATVQDAIEVIVNEAKHRQIVILNEAHHVPMHRAFAMLLARELKKIGYDYLACEAFTNLGSTPPLAKGYVSEDSGIYTRESMYADFLREAIQSHWKFISYEPTERAREYYMAKNLVDRIFKQNPKAKVFIYVGYAHGNKLPKSEDENDRSMMAAQLQKMTGINPLTIDQTTLFQQYVNKIQIAAYNEAVKSHQIEKPSVLITPQNTYLKLGHNFLSGEAYDIQVIYPTYENNPETGRASWLESMAGLNPENIPSKLIPKKGKRLIYAYSSKEPADAVPVDVVLVEAGKPIPKLMLPKGNFRYAFED